MVENRLYHSNFVSYLSKNKKKMSASSHSMEHEESLFSNISNSAKLDELIERKQRYISSFQFEKAKQVDKMISDLKQNDYNDYISRAEEYLLNKIDEFLDLYNENVEQINKNANAENLDIRTRYDDYFVEMKAKHIHELTELEKNKAYEIVYNLNRPIKSAKEFQRRSLVCAKMNQFDKACEYREMAKNEEVVVKNKRTEEIKTKYNAFTQQILDNMRSEMKVLSEKLVQALNNSEKTLKKDLENQLRLVKVSIQNETQKCISKLISIYTDSKIKKEIITHINSTVHQKVDHLGMKLTIDQMPSPFPSYKNTKKVSQPSIEEEEIYSEINIEQTEENQSSQHNEIINPDNNENNIIEEQENQSKIENNYNKEEENQEITDINDLIDIPDQPNEVETESSNKVNTEEEDQQIQQNTLENTGFQPDDNFTPESSPNPNSDQDGDLSSLLDDLSIY